MSGSDFFAVLKQEQADREAAKRESQSPTAAESQKESETGKVKPGGAKSPKGFVGFLNAHQ